MKRSVIVILAILLLLGAYACAENSSARDLALQMAQSIPEMHDIREAPLQDAPDRAAWTDVRTDARCDLAVYASAAAAQRAAVQAGTRSTAARVVGCCVLGIDSDLSIQIIDAYQRCLGQVLGIEPSEQEPDYILNVNTKKFHDPACSSVEQMKETNRQPYSGERAYLIEQGYEACKNCRP